ncbi:MAG TPA: 4'-phosphopantetheinyl transferase superfamily protein [Candidatus Eubacterium avistercoris]|uniref:4'-phosphopantetheinyl transferase superfamily protein n=1 Tax=Candidatus Eubacterium avistercoris TaxID=2838567 RepID=A0A9D2D400_9FIRM|nr:4'-phosphopantetheinyl transferase superfamily protein [Candidatus Eubacterium avistercoris]
MDVMIYYTGWDGKNGSHRLLLEAAADWLREQDRTDQIDALALMDPGTYQKPYFSSPSDIGFSISHSGNFWMCAFGRGELGLDVQGSQKCSPKRLAERFFHPKEAEWLERNGYRDFLQVWTAKESYLKYTGEGLTAGMDFFSTADANGLRGQIRGAAQRHFWLTWSSKETGDRAAVCITGKTIGQIGWKQLDTSVEGTFKTRIGLEETEAGPV